LHIVPCNIGKGDQLKPNSRRAAARQRARRGRFGAKESSPVQRLLDARQSGAFGGRGRRERPAHSPGAQMRRITSGVRTGAVSRLLG
jgi:hypothetical protein